MKRTIILLAAVMLTGCAYNYPYSHVGMGPLPAETPTSMYTVVNNSGYKLAIYQDGRYLGDLGLGQVQPIKTGFLWTKTVIVATGTTPDNKYVGSAKWIFECGIAEAWSVTKLTKPEQP
jgi:hypothetical protein